MRNLFYLGLIILSLYLLFPFSYSLVVGTNKLTLNFQNVLRGGYAEDSFIVSTDSDEPFTVYVVARGNISDWISFENDTFNISSQQPQEVKVIVQPPDDVPNGNYSGIIYVRTSPIGEPQTKMGSSVVASIQLRINVEIVGNEIIDCVVGGATIKDSEENAPLTFEANIKNTGNVKLAPTAIVEIYDQEEKYLLDTYTLQLTPALLPTTSNIFIKDLDHDLKRGQYWAIIKFPECSSPNQRKVTFDIYRQGEILDKGTFIKLENKPWAKTNEVVELKAYFKNTGSRLVYAKFIGKVYDENNNLITIIETDKYAINPSETGIIVAYFKPTYPGKYFIEGRILYNNKYSEMKSSVLNVRGKAMIPIYQILLLLFLLIILVFLIIKIIETRSEKKKFKF